MAKNRIFYYDALRALAIFGIITCHMTAKFIVKAHPISLYNLKWMFLLFINSFRCFAIPIFVMISGALLVNKDYSLPVFIKKKFNRIFIPYLFWAAVLVVFSYILIHLGFKANIINDFSIQYILTSVVGLNPGFEKGRVFWFIWMILTVYVVLFVLNKLLKHVDEKTNSRIINILVILFILYCLTIEPVFSIRLNPFKDVIPYYISFAGYGLLGYYLANADFANISERLKFDKKTVFLISGILFVLLYIYCMVYLTDLCAELNKFATIQYFNILSVLLSSSLFLSFRYFEEAYKENNDSIFSKIKNGKTGAFINSLSKYSFSIYLVHSIVFIFYYYVLFGSMHIRYNSLIKWSLLYIVLDLFTSWAIVWIMTKIPYLEKVSGAS